MVATVINFAEARDRMRPRSLARQHFDQYGFYTDCPVKWKSPYNGWRYGYIHVYGPNTLVVSEPRQRMLGIWPTEQTSFWDETHDP